jgi:Zn-dependent protease
MAEIAAALGTFSALLMVISLAIWASWLRGPLLQRLDGERASNAASAGIAINLLVAAFGVSAVAAVLAIVAWISP